MKQSSFFPAVGTLVPTEYEVYYCNTYLIRVLVVLVRVFSAVSFRFTPVPSYTLLYSSREQYPCVHCHKGLRLHGAVSDKVRDVTDELCFILERCAGFA